MTNIVSYLESQQRQAFDEQDEELVVWYGYGLALLNLVRAEFSTEK